MEIRVLELVAGWVGREGEFQFLMPLPKQNKIHKNKLTQPINISKSDLESQITMYAYM